MFPFTTPILKGQRAPSTLFTPQNSRTTRKKRIGKLWKSTEFHPPRKIKHSDIISILQDSRLQLENYIKKLTFIDVSDSSYDHETLRELNVTASALLHHFEIQNEPFRLIVSQLLNKLSALPSPNTHKLILELLLIISNITRIGEFSKFKDTKHDNAHDDSECFSPHIPGLLSKSHIDINTRFSCNSSKELPNSFNPEFLKSDDDVIIKERKSPQHSLSQSPPVYDVQNIRKSSGGEKFAPFSPLFELKGMPAPRRIFDDVKSESPSDFSEKNNETNPVASTTTEVEDFNDSDNSEDIFTPFPMDKRDVHRNHRYNAESEEVESSSSPDFFIFPTDNMEPKPKKKTAHFLNNSFFALNKRKSKPKPTPNDITFSKEGKESEKDRHHTSDHLSVFSSGTSKKSPLHKPLTGGEIFNLQVESKYEKLPSETIEFNPSINIDKIKEDTQRRLPMPTLALNSIEKEKKLSQKKILSRSFTALSLDATKLRKLRKYGIGHNDNDDDNSLSSDLSDEDANEETLICRICDNPIPKKNMEMHSLYCETIYQEDIKAINIEEGLSKICRRINQELDADNSELVYNDKLFLLSLHNTAKRAIEAGLKECMRLNISLLELSPALYHASRRGARLFKLVKRALSQKTKSLQITESALNQSPSMDLDSPRRWSRPSSASSGHSNSRPSTSNSNIARPSSQSPNSSSQNITHTYSGPETNESVSISIPFNSDSGNSGTSSESSALLGGDKKLPPPRRAVSQGTATALHQLPTIKDFTILKPITRGGFANIWLARKKRTGDIYAIKVMKRKALKAKNQLDRVRIERNILKKANNPFVVKMFYAFATKENLYIVMEYLGGGDCFSLLQNLGSLDTQTAKIYIAEAVLALEYLHSVGIVHRDMKPDNMLIDNSGHIKLTDFGLSHFGLIDKQSIALHSLRRVPSSVNFNDPQFLESSTIKEQGSVEKNSRLNFDSDLSMPNTPVFLQRGMLSPTAESWRLSNNSLEFSAKKPEKKQDTPENSIEGEIPNGFRPAGTPDYLAPEVLLGMKHSAPVDWWALGIILFEFLTGLTPFSGDSVDKIFENTLKRRIVFPDDIDPDARDLIDKLLCLQPESRLGAAGSTEIKNHRFFKNIDWDTILTQTPPFVPELDDDFDTSFFDARQSAYPLSSDIMNTLTGIEEVEIDDFYFVNFNQLAVKNAEMIRKTNNKAKKSKEDRKIRRSRRNSL